MNHANFTYWTRIALLNFIVAAIAGLVMRYAFFGNLAWPSFKNILQAHSHLAMLGWVFLVLILLIGKAFDMKALNKHNLLLWLQLSVVAMFFSLLFVGYQSISIVFLSVHMLLAVVLVIRIYRNADINLKGYSTSRVFLLTAFFFLVLSFLGPLALGPIAYMGLKGSAWYYAAIQFFLHFQFNGWMIFTLLALFFRFLESQDIRYSKKLAKQFYVLLLASCFFTYALAIAWSNPYIAVFIINSNGVVLQLLALILFWKIIWNINVYIKEKTSRFIYGLFIFSFLMFSFKIMIQSCIVLPVIAEIAYTIRFFVIGFMHLILLGVVSCSILAFLFHHGLLPSPKQAYKWGLKIFIAGFLLSEICMFFQGIFLWANLGFIPAIHEILFAVSTLIPLGLIVIYISGKGELGMKSNEHNEQYLKNKLII